MIVEVTSILRNPPSKKAVGLKPYKIINGIELQLIPVTGRMTFPEKAVEVFWMTDKEVEETASTIQNIKQLRDAVEKQLSLVNEMLPTLLKERYLIQQHDTSQSQPARS